MSGCIRKASGKTDAELTGCVGVITVLAIMASGGHPHFYNYGAVMPTGLAMEEFVADAHCFNTQDAVVGLYNRCLKVALNNGYACSLLTDDHMRSWSKGNVIPTLRNLVPSTWPPQDYLEAFLRAFSLHKDRGWLEVVDSCGDLGAQLELLANQQGWERFNASTGLGDTRWLDSVSKCMQLQFFGLPVDKVCYCCLPFYNDAVFRACYDDVIVHCRS